VPRLYIVVGYTVYAFDLIDQKQVAYIRKTFRDLEPLTKKKHRHFLASSSSLVEDNVAFGWDKDNGCVDMTSLSMELERWLMLRYAMAERPRLPFNDDQRNKSWRRTLESHNKGFIMAVTLNMFVHYTTAQKRRWSVLRPTREQYKLVVIDSRAGLDMHQIEPFYYEKDQYLYDRSISRLE